VNSHVRTTSLANVMPPGATSKVNRIEPIIRTSTDDDERSDTSDLVKDRSPLADLLYLRCKSLAS